MSPSHALTVRRWVQGECLRLGYHVFHQHRSANLVAVRVLPGRANHFDDFLTLSWVEGAEWVTRWWAVTTDPGKYHLENPGKVEGTAIVYPGQYRVSHSMGRHRQRYPALVQTGELAVWRDPDRDGQPDRKGEPYWGTFGINVHASDSDPFDEVDPNPAHLVNKWSAGCVVFADSADYRDFWEAIEMLSRAQGPRFTLTVLEVDEADSPF